MEYIRIEKRIVNMMHFAWEICFLAFFTTLAWEPFVLDIVPWAKMLGILRHIPKNDLGMFFTIEDNFWMFKPKPHWYYEYQLSPYMYYVFINNLYKEERFERMQKIYPKKKKKKEEKSWLPLEELSDI